MTDAEKAAYVISQTGCAICEAAAMYAANWDREHHGLAIAYTEQDFQSLPAKFCITHNQVRELFL